MKLTSAVIYIFFLILEAPVRGITNGLLLNDENVTYFTYCSWDVLENFQGVKYVYAVFMIDTAVIYLYTIAVVGESGKKYQKRQRCSGAFKAADAYDTKNYQCTRVL